VNVETLGHAGLLLRDDAGAPVLFTDPWVMGSCYWRSWWLQNYPTDGQLAELRTVPYCLITHEHPDHFHTASIRHLGSSVRYLSPEFPNGHIVGYLRSQGHQAAVVPALTWVSLRRDVRILSVPLFNDDSALVVDTPGAVLINLNDSKPRRWQLQQLAASLDELAPSKRRVLLCSYSPASIVNSFVRDATRISLREKADYVRAVSEHCRVLKIDDFLPFASQVIFKRRDSAWANDFKVTFDDLVRHWTGTARLLPPYTTLDLADGSFTSVPVEMYRHEDSTILPKVAAQEALDEQAALCDADLTKLQQKLNHCRWLLAALFPRGIGFELETVRLSYSPWSGTLRKGEAAGDFVLRVPVQAFKDAVRYGHFGDLGTTMFTMVMLNSGIHPRRVYLFFLVITLHDYGHTASLASLVGWLRHSARTTSWKVPRRMGEADLVWR
jgi:hypothetical protein